MASDLFVISPGLHTFFRLVAAFVIAPLLIWKGWQLEDILVTGIGFITLVVDSFTFWRSVKAIRQST